MICDRLKNAALYRNLNANVGKALEFLQKTNIVGLSVGRHTIDGDEVYANVQRYHQKPTAEATWEAHRKYIDVQFIAQGVERIGYAPLREDSKAEQPYSSDDDVCFYDVVGDLLEVRAGDFAVFFPNDIHAPCLAHETTRPGDEVLKVVVKCRCE